MGRQKRKTNIKEVRNPRMMNNITEERYVELQTEAFYNAMKKLEEENNNVDKVVEIEKTSVWQDIGFMFWLIICPKKAKENYGLRDDITNGIFSMISSVIMRLIGVGIKLLSLIGIVLDVYYLCYKGIHLSYFIVVILICLFNAMLGSLFSLASDEISRERNNSVIMSYTSNILAFVSIMIAIVAIVVAL